MKTMIKKQYLSPAISIEAIDMQPLMAGSLDPTEDNTSTTVSDEEWNGEFSSNGGGFKIWNDEDE